MTQVALPLVPAEIVTVQERTETILAVESERADRVLLAESFREAGALPRLCFASDGESVLGMLEGGAPAPRLVLLRADLPRTSGLQVLAAIKEHPTWGAVPVMVFVGRCTSEEVAQFYQQQAAACVKKPSELDGWLRLAEGYRRFWLNPATQARPEVYLG